MASYFLTPTIRFKNVVLVIASLLFFAWGGPSLTAILLASVIGNYFFGRLIDSAQKSRFRKLNLGIAILGNLGLLIVFKYANFFIENLNVVRDVLHLLPFELPDFVLPLGISFFTFQAISYLIDVYRKQVPAQKNFFHLALYITFFPQLVAGPIIRYKDFADQITNRKHSLEKFASGIERFSLGMAKKMLIANQLGLAVDQIYAIGPEHLSTEIAWLGAITYSLQIYFDFSAYSDMAIGLARMLGFELAENFNFPYIARSIREFWHRWHISLSTWFRDYLYIPLGGSRGNQWFTFRNLTIVFLVTGFWHGASWNFIVWGMLHGCFLLLERVLPKEAGIRRIKPLAHLYTLGVVVLTFVLFRADDLSSGMTYLQTMFTINQGHPDLTTFIIEFHPAFWFILSIAILSSTRIWLVIGSWFQTWLNRIDQTSRRIALTLIDMMEGVMVLSVLFLSTTLLIGDSYNPFIYFRF